MQNQIHRFCVAPMMEWTDRHCRAFHRILTRRAVLYTEMVTAAAIVHGDRERLIGFSEAEHPLALQVGGAEPRQLAEAARIGADFGYDEINLNVGCPSDRVQQGRFGACLMAEADLVAECVAAMRAVVRVPVTVKCRIGIRKERGQRAHVGAPVAPQAGAPDDGLLEAFVATVAAAGCRTFVVHAREAWLEGLSPKENREVPPLDYARVHRLKAARPDLEIILNGGIATLAAAETALAHVDGVMLGRAAYQNPYLLADVDHRIYGEAGPAPTRREVLERLMPYVEAQLGRGTPLHAVTRHVLGLYHGRPRARAFRRQLSELGPRAGAGIGVLRMALAIAEADEIAAAALEAAQ